MMVNMFLVEELSYNEHKRKGSGCEADTVDFIDYFMNNIEKNRIEEYGQNII